MKTSDIVSGLLSYVIVSVILLVMLSIILSIMVKKFKLSNKKIKLYGLLMDLNNKSLISISAITINFTFIIWWMLNFSGLNIMFAIFSIILMVIPALAFNKPSKLISLLLYNSVNFILIEIIYKLYDILINGVSNYILVPIFFLLIIFAFLYNAFILFKELNNIIISNKHIKDKKRYQV